MERRQETRRLVAELFQAAPRPREHSWQAVSGSPRCFKPTDQAQPAATRTALLKLAASDTMLPQYTGPGSSSFKPAAQHTSPPRPSPAGYIHDDLVSSQRHSTPRRHNVAQVQMTGGPMFQASGTAHLVATERYSLAALGLCQFQAHRPTRLAGRAQPLLLMVRHDVSSPQPGAARCNCAWLPTRSG
jgi:hypothetical protein